MLHTPEATRIAGQQCKRYQSRELRPVVAILQEIEDAVANDDVSGAIRNLVKYRALASKTGPGTFAPVTSAL